MKKKIGLLVGLAFLPMTSFAMTSDTCFELEGGRIIDYHAERGACGLEVVIPAQINEDEVSEIAEKAFSHKGIRSVVLPSTISFI